MGLVPHVVEAGAEQSKGWASPAQVASCVRQLVAGSCSFDLVSQAGQMFGWHLC